MKNKLVVSIALLIAIADHAQEATKSNVTEFQKNAGVKLSIHLNGMSKFYFNCIDNNGFTSDLEFKNPTRSDTVIKRTINTPVPIHIFSAELFVAAPGSPVTEEYHTLLLIPGDSIVINKEKKVVYSTHGIGYIDSIIDNRNIYSLQRGQLVAKTLKEHGLKYVLNQANGRYKASEEIINKLPKDDIELVTALHKLNYLSKAAVIGAIPFDHKSFTSFEKSSIDSLYKEIERKIDVGLELNSPFSYPVLHSLISYNAFMQGKPTQNFWNYFTAVDPKIKQGNLYKSLLLNVISLNFNSDKRIDNMTKTIARITDAGIVDSRYDSLLQEKIAFRQKSLQSRYIMVKSNGEKTEYFSLLRSLKGSYVFVDFWASWCGPCRQQIPYLRKLKSEFNNKNIKFVSISIDKDDDGKQWIAASKEEGLFEESLSFRLLNGNVNPLLSMFEIETIPRYLLYNLNGDLISGNFMTPDKEEFKSALLKELSR